MSRRNHSGQFLSLFSVLVLACASLPRPTSADVARAQTRFQNASLSSLEAGRRAFADNCSSCHALPRPDAKSPEQWAKVIDQMAAEAKLDASTKELVGQFLVTMSERTTSATDQKKIDQFSGQRSNDPIADNSRSQRGD
jgi:hypothetical protein